MTKKWTINILLIGIFAMMVFCTMFSESYGDVYPWSVDKTILPSTGGEVNFLVEGPFKTNDQISVELINGKVMGEIKIAMPIPSAVIKVNLPANATADPMIYGFNVFVNGSWVGGKTEITVSGIPTQIQIAKLTVDKPVLPSTGGNVVFRMDGDFVGAYNIGVIDEEGLVSKWKDQQLNAILDTTNEVEVSMPANDLVKDKVYTFMPAVNGKYLYQPTVQVTVKGEAITLNQPPKKLDPILLTPSVSIITADYKSLPESGGAVSFLIEGSNLSFAKSVGIVDDSGKYKAEAPAKEPNKSEWLTVVLPPNDQMTPQLYTFHALINGVDAKEKISFTLAVNGKSPIIVQPPVVQPPTVQPPQNNKKIEEVCKNASDWAKPTLEKALTNNLIPGILEGQDMKRPINREEFCELAVQLVEKLNGQKLTTSDTNPFQDTNNLQILKAYKIGITAGTAPGKFEPYTMINREQCATMLFHALQAAKPGNNFKSPGAKDFADQTQISTWAVEATRYMAGKGIIVGDQKGNFMPKPNGGTVLNYGMATREQAIIMATNASEKLK